MPVWTLWQSGCTFGTPPTLPNNKKRDVEKRGEVIGWTPKATRSLTKWLYGADVKDLGQGLAFTLTIKDLPDDAAAWQNVRAKFFKRLKRLGVSHLHWLTEWQLRKMPHLHGCLWFPPGAQINPRIKSLISNAWLQSAKQYSPAEHCQDVKEMHSYLGWKQYLSKHASRSAHNSQRCTSNMPETWKTSGRMWGCWGDFEIKKIELELCEKGGHALRRIIKGWRIATARSEPHPQKRKTRLQSAKKLYRSDIKNLSSVRGFSEWLELDQQLKIMHYLNDNGYTIEN